MTCIFCLKTGLDPSVEHVIAKALGAELTIDDVCGPCNGTLGSEVDFALTDHVLMIDKRAKYGLAGNSGTVPDMTRLLLNGPGTWTLNGVEHKVVLTADKDGVHDVYLAPAVEIDYDETSGAVTVRAQMDERDEQYLRKRIVAAMRKKSVPDPLQEQVLAKLETPVAGSQQPTVNKQIRVGGGDELRRPIAKIACELAYRWFGPAYLTHPRAEDLRRFILDGADVTDVAIFARPEEIARFTQLASPPTEHVAMVVPHSVGYYVLVKLFDALVGSVRVSTHADATFPLPYQSAIRFDTTTRTHQYLNLIEFAAAYDPNAAMYLQTRPKSA